MNATYKNVRYAYNGDRYYIVGCRSAGEFDTLSDLRRYIDDNTWACPREAGG